MNKSTKQLISECSFGGSNIKLSKRMLAKLCALGKQHGWKPQTKAELIQLIYPYPKAWGIVE